MDFGIALANFGIVLNLIGLCIIPLAVILLKISLNVPSADMKKVTLSTAFACLSTIFFMQTIGGLFLIVSSSTIIYFFIYLVLTVLTSIFFILMLLKALAVARNFP